RLESLPELQSRYHELSRDYESKKKKYDALAIELDGKKLQLEMERASGRAHYDIITPPTAEEPSVTRTMIKRAGMGGVVGLVLAVMAAAVLELRQRILARRRWRALGRGTARRARPSPAAARALLAPRDDARQARLPGRVRTGPRPCARHV